VINQGMPQGVPFLLKANQYRRLPLNFLVFNTIDQLHESPDRLIIKRHEQRVTKPMNG